MAKAISHERHRKRRRALRNERISSRLFADGTAWGTEVAMSLRGNVLSIVRVSRQPVREPVNIGGVPAIQPMKRCLTSVHAETIQKEQKSWRLSSQRFRHGGKQLVSSKWLVENRNRSKLLRDGQHGHR